MEHLYKNANAVVGLERLYARLMGELKRIERESAKLLDETERRLASLAAERTARSEQLKHVAASLSLLVPGVTLEHIQPVVTTKRLARLPYGGLRGGILAILRTSEDWMTAREIHDALIVRNNLLYPDEVAKGKHRQKLREALHVLLNLDPSRVEREHDLPKSNFKIEQRWRLGSMFRD